MSGGCAMSKRADGKHSWTFDCDDPYVVCKFCGEMRDSLNGRIIRSALARVGDTPQEARHPCDECGGSGFRVGQACCGNTYDGECRGDCSVPEQVDCEYCGGSGSECDTAQETQR